MAANRVEIDINANDHASPVINTVINNFSRLNGAVGGSNIAIGSFMGSLGAGIALKGLEGILSTVGNIKDTLLEASKIETAFKTSASSTAMNLKVSYEVGESIQKQLGKEIATAAASQPGSTQDYVQIANMISGSVARGYEGDSKGFLEASKELIKTSGLLATTKGIDATSAGSTIGRFVNGSSSFNQLKNIDYFEKNQDLVFKINEVAKDRGLDTEKLQEWTQKQRIEVLKAASSQVISPELLASLNATADAKLESLKSQLFDPQIGVFGFLRELPSMGGKSILDGFANFLDAFSALGSVVGKLAGQLGLSFDPLEPLARFIDWISSVLDSITVGLSKLNPSRIAFTFGTLDGFFEMFSNLKAWDFGKAITEFYSSFLNSISDLLVSTDWVLVGRTIAQFFMKAADFIMSILINTDYGAILRLVLSIVKAIIGVVAGIVTEMLYTIFKDIGRSISDAFKFVVDTIMGAVNAIKQAFQALTDGIQNIVNKIPTPQGVLSGVSNGFNGIVSGVANAVTGGNNRPVTTSRLNTRNAGRLPNNKPKDEKSVLPPFSPILNVNPSQGMDENALAKKVVNYLNEAYNNYNTAVLG